LIMRGMSFGISLSLIIKRNGKLKISGRLFLKISLINFKK
jgi:hypothetical protein